MQTNVLKSKMALANINQRQLTGLMKRNGVPIDLATLNLKINGHREFKQGEILAIIKSLNLSQNEAMNIFFTSNVS